MDFWDLTKLVFRRWYVALPLVVLTAVLTVYTTAKVKPDYKATSYVQLIPPPAASTTTNIKDLQNPWLDLGLGALDTAATYAVVDQTFLGQLKQQGLSDNVVITAGYPAPIATVEVIAPSQEIAGQTTDLVVQHFDEVVKALQNDYGVKPAGLILTRRLDTGKNLSQTGGKVKRALIAVAGAGLLLTAGITIGFDALMRRRKNRRSRRVMVASPADQTVAITIKGTALPPRSAVSGAHRQEIADGIALGEQASNGQEPVGYAPHAQARASVASGSDITIVLPRTVDPPAVDGESTRR